MADHTKPDAGREAFNLIKAQAEAFFEWPTADKSHVTTTSALLFAESMPEKERSAFASCPAAPSATAVAYMVVSPSGEYRYPIRPDQHDDYIRRGFKLHPILASGQGEVVPRAEYTAALRLLTDRIAELEACPAVAKPLINLQAHAETQRDIYGDYQTYDAIMQEVSAIREAIARGES